MHIIPFWERGTITLLLKSLKIFLLNLLREISIAKCPILPLLVLIAGISNQLFPAVLVGTV